MHFFDGFGGWIWAVLDHWEVIVVTGAIPFVIELVDKLFDWKLPKKVYAIFVGIGLFLAMFSAWKEENKRADGLSSQVSTLQTEVNDLKNPSPDFAIAPPESAFTYIPQRDLTSIFLVVGVANKGAPSIAGGWKLAFSSPVLTTTVNFVKLPTKVRGPHMEGNFKDEDSIYEKMFQKPLERGAAVAGWAYFEIPGKIAFDELDKGDVTMHLICYDYLSKEHQSGAFGPEKGAIIPQYFPGMGGGFTLKPPKSKQP